MADIVKQLNEMQAELNELKSYKKSVQKIIKKFDEIEPKKEVNSVSDFEQKICEYFELKSESDKQKYLEVMLNEHSKNFWNSRR